MILSQRPLAVTRPDDSSEPGKLSTPVIDLNSGDLLHCQLIARVTSEQKDAPVRARSTAPLIRRGRVILPAGTNLSGQMRSVEGGQMQFDRKWAVQLPSGARAQIEGVAQQMAFDPASRRHLATDGNPGIPSHTTAVQERKDSSWKKILGTFASAAGRMTQERTRTALGDQIPASARNVLLEGASDLVDDRTEALTAIPTESRPKPHAEVPPGTVFYIEIQAPNGAGN